MNNHDTCVVCHESNPTEHDTCSPECEVDRAFAAGLIHDYPEETR